jgi:hypothetical protein
MNISTLRTSVKGGNAAFGATALNERNRLVTESTKTGPGLTANLAETAPPPTRVERNRGEPDPPDSGVSGSTAKILCHLVHR